MKSFITLAVLLISSTVYAECAGCKSARGRTHVQAQASLTQVYQQAFAPQPQSAQVKVAVTVQARQAGQHSHRCGKCGYVWSHFPGGSHTCAKCGYSGRSNYVQIGSSASASVNTRRGFFRRR